VGAHLIAHLEQSGDEVRGIDREHDVTSAASMREVFDEFRPEVTYHLAALTHVGDSWQHASEFTRVNVVGTQRVLDAAHAAVPASLTVIVSSAEVYGKVLEEDQPLRESFASRRRILLCEQSRSGTGCHEAARVRGQRVIIARPFNHLGPGQALTFVVPALVSRLLDAAKRGEDEIVVGDLSTRRDFSDVRDVVRAYHLLRRWERRARSTRGFGPRRRHT